MSTRVWFSSGVSNVDKSIPAAVNAASVGANTVNGPSPSKVVTRLAWISACTRAPTGVPGVEAVAGMSSSSAGGNRTASITCTTPLLAITSAVVTFAPSIETTPSWTWNVALSPFSIVTSSPSVTASDCTAPAKTW